MVTSVKDLLYVLICIERPFRHLLMVECFLLLFQVYIVGYV